MTEPSGVDESGFGLGGESSRDADVDAAYDDGRTGETATLDGAEEAVPDSALADEQAATDDDSPLNDPTDLRPE